ncbi:glycosyltransferase family protein [Acinetobacter sp.]|uniref:glycosyltransferase family protein n=1 Tax=Acinetobacter sp. TaxID=472 RepID=UPI000C483B77|nr:glycosyltransferase family protein [Acinetobacter sp.]MBC69478.1 acylneuraminate cytidylyltransferase [Acinetobacter sp.]
MTNVIIIIQARFSSNRLPGKVMMKINNKTVLERVYERVSLATKCNKVVVATSDHKTDDVIYELCNQKNINVFRGSLENVLERFYLCSKYYSASTIVRVTADCPLICPRTIDSALEKFNSNNFDYLSNTCPPQKSSFPDGSDVEIFTFNALEKSYFNESKYKDNEHVTFQFWKEQSSYSSYLMEMEDDYSSLRYTLDYPEDLEVIKFIISELEKSGKDGSVREIVELLMNNPEISKLNSKYHQGIGWN